MFLRSPGHNRNSVAPLSSRLVVSWYLKAFNGLTTSCFFVFNRQIQYPLFTLCVRLNPRQIFSSEPDLRYASVATLHLCTLNVRFRQNSLNSVHVFVWVHIQGRSWSFPMQYFWHFQKVPSQTAHCWQCHCTIMLFFPQPRSTLCISES